VRQLCPALLHQPVSVRQVEFSYRLRLRFTLARYIRLHEHRGHEPGDFNHNETSVAPNTTKPGSGVGTPPPIQTGMTGSYETFQFVKDGENCASIAKEAGISLADFYCRKMGVGSSCQSLWLETYVCVAVSS
jgi:hypothetical protein